jgi:NAD(P)-dependent dehydrogenase (short-subunit alcohol dehydrogenase family)
VTYVITGIRSGLGACLGSLLMQDRSNSVIGLDIQGQALEACPLPCDLFLQCDISDPNSIQDAMEEIGLLGTEVDVLINCAAVNEIKWLEDLKVEQWDRLMNTNARSIFLLTQALLPKLIKSKGTVLNIVSNASHMPMTASLAYNASKGAAHIMTLQLARELTKLHGITVFGVSPNKMAGTQMSNYIESRVPIVRGWSLEQAAAYQKQALLTGEETDPNTLAEFICFLLSSKQRHKYLSGCIIPYGA